MVNTFCWSSFLLGVFVCFLELIMEFRPQYMRCSSFEILKYFWNICRNRKWEKAVYMVFFTSNSKDIDIFFFTYSSDDNFETFDDRFSKDFSSIFGYPNKMTCEVIGSMRGMMVVKWMLCWDLEKWFAKILRIFWLWVCHIYTGLYSFAIDSIFTIGLKSSSAGVLTQREQRYIVPVYVGATA